MPYSCQAQLATSGSIVWPDGAGIAVLGIGREMSHTSRLTIVHMITLPPSGGFRGGRSTIAEYGLRSWGVMAPSWVSSPGPEAAGSKALVLGRDVGPVPSRRDQDVVKAHTRRQAGDIANEIAKVLGLQHSGLVLVADGNRTLGENRGRDLARGERRGPNPVSALLHVDALAQRDHAVLRGDIAGSRLRAHEAPRDRGDIDDHAILLLAHDRQSRERPMKGARQVRPDQVFDTLWREPLPTPVGNVRPGIVDQNIEASEF